MDLNTFAHFMSPVNWEDIRLRKMVDIVQYIVNIAYILLLSRVFV
jgi:hypothetical protein